MTCVSYSMTVFMYDVCLCMTCVSYSMTVFMYDLFVLQYDCVYVCLVCLTV